MIKQTLCALVALTVLSPAQDLANEPSAASKIWQEDMGKDLAQIGDLRNQLEIAMDALPPTMSRVALHRLRADRKEFSPSMQRFISSMIEEVFAKTGRRDVVSSPELKTTKIISTDTSFVMANALPDAEALWALGKKLRVDGFLDGSLSRSKEGDLLLTIKLVRQESAEVVWNQSFIAGPYKDRAKPANFDWVLGVGWSYWPVEKFETPKVSKESGLVQYRYDVSMGWQQSIDAGRNWFLGVQGAVGQYVPVPDDVNDPDFADAGIKLYGRGGFNLTYVMSRKADPDQGYNMGMYADMYAVMPNALIYGELGYSARLTPYLGLAAGVSFYPFHDELVSGITGKADDISYMKKVSYDARINAYW